MRLCSALILGLLVSACGAPDPSETEAISSPEPLRSGYEFLTEDTQRLQDDPFENPGFLWVDRGAALFETAEPGGQSCADCHDGGLTGTSARYPQIDEASKRLLNLEGRINQCRSTHQGLEPLEYESEALLALTTYVANQSRGQTLARELTQELQPYAKSGQAYFETRRGQFNLSCAQCHDQSWGQLLRGDTISQGHGNGFPAYRLEWQSIGSLHRRLRDCDTGVRAEPLPYGDDTYIAVELYLALRASGLDVETPAVRR